MLIRKLATGAIIATVRPYTRRELPGWGVLYRAFVGTYPRDWLWRGQKRRWVRGKLHGYEMSVDPSGWSNRATFFLERFYDLPTQLLLMRLVRPGDTVVDIGANEGQMTLLSAHLAGPEGKVIAFEPNPGPRGILDSALTRNAITNVTVMAMGLGDRDATLDLAVPRINSGEGSFAHADSAAADDDMTHIACPVRAGDAVLADVTPAVIKIDVEGFEPRVIAGLRATLIRARPVVTTEIIAGHLARGGATPADLHAAFTALDYVGGRLTLSGGRGDRSVAIVPLTDPLIDGDYVWMPRERADAVHAQLCAGS